jgi:spermidine/putrescine-binding protein
MARFGRLARWTATAALLALAPAASAQAATITIYNNQAAWAAAVGAITTEDFADAVLVPGLSITGGSV